MKGKVTVKNHKAGVQKNDETTITARTRKEKSRNVLLMKKLFRVNINVIKLIYDWPSIIFFWPTLFYHQKNKFTFTFSFDVLVKVNYLTFSA